MSIGRSQMAIAERRAEIRPRDWIVMLAAVLLGVVAVLVPGVAGVIVVLLAGLFALTLATRYLFADSEVLTKRVLVWSAAAVGLHLAVGLLSEVVGANVLF